MTTGWGEGWGAGVLIAADGPGGLAAARSAAEAAGIVPRAMLDMAAAFAWLEARSGIDAVLVEIESDSGPILDGLLDLVAARAGDGRIAAVVTMPPHLIDVVVARVPPGAVELLCDPNPLERVGALRSAMALRDVAHPAGVAEDGAGRDPMRLHALSAELARIAEALAAMSGVRGGGTALPAGTIDTGQGAVSTPPDAETVRRLIRARRLRERYFDRTIFGEPVWDMLLDLMASRMEGGSVSVSSLCIAAAVPPTTALRAINGMTSAGLIERRADPGDARRVFVALSDVAADAMARYLAALSALEDG